MDKSHGCNRYYIKVRTIWQHLCEAIDQVLKERPKDFSEVLLSLSALGDEFKDDRQQAFRGKGQKRFLRLRSLGDGYSEEELRAVIHKLLHSCFEQAVKWELVEKNPTDYASLPKAEYKKRDIWTAETLFQALELCEDERLKRCLNLAFACSLRMGGLLVLTWNCIDIFQEAIEAGTASIYVNKELQRVSRDTLNNGGDAKAV